MLSRKLLNVLMDKEIHVIISDNTAECEFTTPAGIDYCFTLPAHSDRDFFECLMLLEHSFDAHDYASEYADINNDVDAMVLDGMAVKELLISLAYATAYILLPVA